MADLTRYGFSGAEGQFPTPEEFVNSLDLPDNADMSTVGGHYLGDYKKWLTDAGVMNAKAAVLADQLKAEFFGPDVMSRADFSKKFTPQEQPQIQDMSPAEAQQAQAGLQQADAQVPLNSSMARLINTLGFPNAAQAYAKADTTVTGSALFTPSEWNPLHQARSAMSGAYGEMASEIRGGLDLYDSLANDGKGEDIADQHGNVFETVDAPTAKGLRLMFGDDYFGNNSRNQLKTQSLLAGIAEGAQSNVDPNASRIGSTLGGAAFGMAPGLLAMKYGGAGAKLAGMAAGTGASYLSMADEGAADYVRTVEKAGGVINQEDKQLMAELNGSLAALDLLPLHVISKGGAIEWLDNVSGGTIKKFLVSRAGGIATGAASEGLTELTQEMGKNLLASNVVQYDPERNAFTGTADAAEGGAMVGAILTGLFQMAGGRKAHMGSVSQDDPLYNVQQEQAQNQYDQLIQSTLNPKQANPAQAKPQDVTAEQPALDAKPVETKPAESQPELHPNQQETSPLPVFHSQYDGLFTSAESKYGLPKGMLSIMAKIESSFDPNAVSDTGATGLFQFTGGTGRQYGLIGKGFDNRTDPAANTDAAARLARDNIATLEKNNVPVSPFTIYMAHQQGAGGLSQIFKAARTGKISPELRYNMDVNGGKGLDAAQFLQKWQGIFEKKVGTKTGEMLPAYNPDTIGQEHNPYDRFIAEDYKAFSGDTFNQNRVDFLHDSTDLTTQPGTIESGVTTGTVTQQDISTQPIETSSVTAEPLTDTVNAATLYQPAESITEQPTGLSKNLKLSEDDGTVRKAIESPAVLSHMEYTLKELPTKGRFSIKDSGEVVYTRTQASTAISAVKAGKEPTQQDMAILRDMAVKARDTLQAKEQTSPATTPVRSMAQVANPAAANTEQVVSHPTGHDVVQPADTSTESVQEYQDVTAAEYLHLIEQGRAELPAVTRKDGQSYKRQPTLKSFRTAMTGKGVNQQQLMAALNEATSLYNQTQRAVFKPPQSEQSSQGRTQASTAKPEGIQAETPANLPENEKATQQAGISVDPATIGEATQHGSEQATKAEPATSSDGGGANQPPHDGQDGGNEPPPNDGQGDKAGNSDMPHVAEAETSDNYTSQFTESTAAKEANSLIRNRYNADPQNIINRLTVSATRIPDRLKRSYANAKRELSNHPHSTRSTLTRMFVKYLTPDAGRADVAELVRGIDNKKSSIGIMLENDVAGLQASIQAIYGKWPQELSDAQSRQVMAALRGEQSLPDPEHNQMLISYRERMDKASELLMQRLAQSVDFAFSELPPDKTQQALDLMDKLRRGDPAEDLTIPPWAARAATYYSRYLTVKNNLGAYVNTSYKMFTDKDWNRKVRQMPEYDNAVKWMHGELTQRNPDATETDANAEINAMLDEWADKYQAFTAIGKKSNAILKQRKELPAEIKALLGEINDPVVNYLNTTTKIMDYVINHDFQTKLRNAGLEGGFFSLKKGGDSGTMTAQFTKANADEWSMLGDVWMDQVIADQLDALQPPSFSLPWALETLIGAQAAVKMGATVYSTATTGANYLSGFVLTMAGGHNPFTPSGLKQAWDVIEGSRARISPVSGSYVAGDAALQKKAQRLAELGVIRDGATSQELKGIIADFRQAADSKGTTQPITRFLERLYQGGDDIFRIVHFEAEMADLIDSGMDPGTAELAAAKRTRDMMPTYSKVPKGVKNLRWNPLVGTFTSFPAEVLRTTFNQAKYTEEDLKAGRIKMAAKRATNMAIADALLPIGLPLASALMAGVSDEEKDFIDKHSPEWVRDSAKLYYRDENGEVNYFSLRSILPSEYVWGAIRKALDSDGADDKSIVDSFASFGTEMGSPYLGLDMTMKAFMEVAFNSSNGKPIYTPGKSFSDLVGEPEKNTDDVAAATGYLYGKLAPGFLRLQGRDAIRVAAHPISEYSDVDATTADRFAATQGGAVDRTGNALTAPDALMAAVGLRSQTISIPQLGRDISTQAASQLRNATTSMKRVIGSNVAVSPEAVAQAADDFVSARHEAFAPLQDAVKFYRQRGMPDGAILNLLYSQNANTVGKTDVEYLIRTGEVPPYHWPSDFTGAAELRFDYANQSSQWNALKVLAIREQQVKQLVRQAEDSRKSLGVEGVLNPNR